MIRFREPGPFVVAVAASLVLHGAALAAVLWGWTPSRPDPVETRTVALVIVDGPPVPDAVPEAAARPVPLARPRLTPVAAHPAPPPPKPITPDPRVRAFPVFKPPPRRPRPPAESAPQVLEKAAPPQTVTAALPVVPALPTQVQAPPSAAEGAALPAPGKVAMASPPRYGVKGLANPRPRYPWLARQRGEQGRVVIRVAVDAAGAATAVTVKETSGHGRLDRAALRALRHWRFAPARRAGKAVPGTVDVPVTFRLDDDG